MKFDIWSDVVCPFCYIGKRHLEKALEEFPDLEADITWHSFELDPNAPEYSELDIYDSLARKYGQTREWAVEATQNMLEMAEKAGLQYNMDELKPTNSFDAHQLLHLAKQEGKQTAMKERIFAAYFTEGKHIADHETLAELGAGIGLDKDRIKEVLENDEFTSAVNHDVMQAKNIGIQGVPFFLVNQKYGMSGAQPVPNMVETIRQILQKEEEAKPAT